MNVILSTMFLFQFVCKIHLEGELAVDKQFANIGGAYVDIWVHFKEFEGAKLLAQHYAQQAGWLIIKEFSISRIKKRQVRKSEKQFYQEARKYGSSTVARMWPKDAPDADETFQSAES